MGFITLDNIIKLALALVLFVGIYYIINIGNKYVDTRDEIPLTRDRIGKYFLIALLVAIIYILWKTFPVIGTILTIILASMVFSYLISPLVNFFEEKLVDKNIPQGWAIIIVYLIMLGVIALLLGLIIPSLAKEFVNFFNYLPRLLGMGTDILDGLVEKISKGSNFDNLNQVLDEAEKFFNKIFLTGQTYLFGFISRIPDRIPNFLSVFVVIAIVPIVSFYLLKDRKAILDRLKQALAKHDRYRILPLAEDLNLAMSDYVRGRLLMCLFAGVATSIVMFILGLDFAIVIGIITGIADIIPYIGPFIGFIPAFILAAIESPLKAAIMSLAFVIIQWLENNVVGPVILSDRVGLHPVVILFCIFVGGSIGGVLGMIFLTPIVVALRVVAKHFEPEIKGFFSDKFKK